MAEVLFTLLTIPVLGRQDRREFAHGNLGTCPGHRSRQSIFGTNGPSARCCLASSPALARMGMTHQSPSNTAELARCRGADAALQLAFKFLNASRRVSALNLQFIGYILARAFGPNPDQSQDVGDPARFRAAQLLARRGRTGDRAALSRRGDRPSRVSQRWIRAGES